MNTFQKWLVAVRPFAYTASGSAVFLGLAMASYAGYPIHWGRFLFTLLGVVCFHTAANLLNDIYDFQRGLDREVYPMSGAVVRGLLSQAQVMRAALLCLGVGSAAGFYLAYATGWPVMALGIAGAAIALGYSGKAFGFKYQGLGDLVILLAFGILPVLGTYWVQTQTFSWMPVIWFVPIALITVGILHANNWRDIRSDKQRHCRTVASAIGPKRSAQYYRLLILLPFALIAFYFMAGLFIPALKVQPLVLLVLLVLPAAIKLARTSEASELFFRLDGETAKLQLQFGLMLIAGFFISKLVHWV